MYALDTCHAMLNTWYLTLLLAMIYLLFDIWYRYLPCYTYHLIYDTGTCHAILITWYPIPVFAMLYLSLDIRHRYLPCYTYHLISDTGTCHAILIIWYLIPVLAMLYLLLDIWHQYLSYLSPDTWHLILWHLYYIAYSWLLLLRGLGMIIILLPNFWYSWTPVLLNSCNRETPDIMLLALCSC